MKRLLLFVFFIPTLLWAQDDSKYLAGAVPMEDGKVVFTKEFEDLSLSKDEIFSRMLDWANGFFNDESNRVVYSDRAKGDIASIGKANLVFQNTTFSLDRSDMNYRVTMECENQKCKLKVSGIRYDYNVSYQREPEKYVAEEWIIDKYCLNKNKTKLNRGNGKFRRKTIDFIDEMFASASAALGVQTSSAATIVPVRPATPAPSKEGYVAFAADKVPSTLLQMLPESDMQVIPSNDADAKETAAKWEGTDNVDGKSIASISIDKDSPALKKIGKKDTYSLYFYKQGEKEAWLIIDCRKQNDKEEDGSVSLEGEILNVWMK